MIVTAYIYPAVPPSDTPEQYRYLPQMRRVIYNEPAHVDPATFLNDICARQAPGDRVEFGPVSSTGWGRWNR